MKRIPPRRKIVNIKNCEDLEMINDAGLRMTNHWIHWMHYKGRACRDKQICKGYDLLSKGFNKRYAKKM